MEKPNRQRRNELRAGYVQLLRCREKKENTLPTGFVCNFPVPCTQANKWIKAMEGSNLSVVDLNTKDLLRQMGNCIQYGLPCLLQVTIYRRRHRDAPCINAHHTPLRLQQYAFFLGYRLSRWSRKADVVDNRVSSDRCPATGQFPLVYYPLTPPYLFRPFPLFS